MTEPWAPNVSDVGSLLHARTIDNNGNELGTFSSATRPTDTNVNDLIGRAVDDVLDAVGQTVPPDLEESAARIAALGAAMLVEVSFFPEQVGSARSPYPMLKTEYDDQLKRLTQAVEFEGGAVPASEYQVPAGRFGGPPIPVSWWTPW